MPPGLLRQDVLPVAVGYLLVMGALAAGLRLLRRDGDPAAARRAGRGAATRRGGPAAGRPGSAIGPGGSAAGAGGSAAGPGGTEAAAARGGPAAGWRRLARHYAGTALGGYLVLMAVVVVYYYGVARLGGAFIWSAFTGCALLIALSTPVFALASWLAQRRPGQPGRPPTLAHPAAPAPPARPTHPSNHTLTTRPRLRS